MSTLGKETGGPASENKRGLKAIDLVQRERESKGKPNSRKTPKLKEVGEQTLYVNLKAVHCMHVLFFGESV